jgi:DeoR/GlpR family transcriptional regulator of sugar metabolism
MIEFLEMEADHIVAVRVDGKVLSSDIDRAMHAIEEKLATHQRVSFVVEINELSGVTPEAILKDLRYGLEQIKNLRRFHRAAVITDIKWIRAAAGVEDLIIPKVEVKAFSQADRDVAITWASKLPAAV